MSAPTIYVIRFQDHHSVFLAEASMRGHISSKVGTWAGREDRHNSKLSHSFSWFHHPREMPLPDKNRSVAATFQLLLSFRTQACLSP